MAHVWKHWVFHPVASHQGRASYTMCWVEVYLGAAKRSTCPVFLLLTGVHRRPTRRGGGRAGENKGKFWPSWLKLDLKRRSSKKHKGLLVCGCAFMGSAEHLSNITWLFDSDSDVFGIKDRMFFIFHIHLSMLFFKLAKAYCFCLD